MSRFFSAFRDLGPLVIVFISAGLLSTVLSPFPHSAIPGLLNDFVAVSFLFLAAGSSDTRRTLYSRALVGGGFLAVFAALFLSGKASTPWTGPLLNPNLLAALGILVMPKALELCGKGNLRLLWWPVALLLVLGVLFSRSMAAYGTVLVQVILAVIFLMNNSANKSNKHIFVAAGIVLLALVGFYLSRAEWIKLFHGDADRWTWWTSAAHMFASHPILGVGPGAFGEAYPAYRAAPWGLNSLYAHHFILEMLAERGLFGAGTFFLLVGILVVRAGRNVLKGTPPGLFLGGVGFCIYNLFHMGFSFPALYWMFMIAVGLSAYVGEPDFFKRSNSLQGSPHFLETATSKIMTIGLCLLVGVASFSVFRADQWMVLAQVSLSEDRWEEAQESVKKGLFWNRWNPGLYELRAALRMRSQNWEGAKEDLDRAVLLAPASAVFRLESAELARERGDSAQALRDYETATRLMPLKASAWERWGDLLKSLGKPADADRAYAGALLALSDPRVLGGDADRRELFRKRVEEKKQRCGHDKKD